MADPDADEATFRRIVIDEVMKESEEEREMERRWRQRRQKVENTSHNIQ